MKEFFEELEISFKPKSFGIIPVGNERGGHIILKKLQKSLRRIETETILSDFKKEHGEFTVDFEKNDGKFTAECKFLALATGGFAGKFRQSNNFRYKKYNVFGLVEKNGGKIINSECVFRHPFGYGIGKSVLLGNEVAKGKFIDSQGNAVFDKRISKLLEENNYHEVFREILKQSENRRKKNRKVFFEDARGKIEVFPVVHYTAGGIKANAIGEVEELPGLFAIGECRADGSKNGGRLPGYPLTSAIVNAKKLAGEISQRIQTEKIKL